MKEQELEESRKKAALLQANELALKYKEEREAIEMELQSFTR
jgi:hypothetical protein